jgi:predicted RNase H-like nuclease (RuvC/YqgF family)
LFEDAQLDAENDALKSAYDKLARKIRNLEMQLNTADTKNKVKDIEKQIDDLNSFREALALGYEIPFDAFETFTEEGEVTEDEYDNAIKVGDKVFSRFSFDDTMYTVKEITPKNYILEDEKGKKISVEISKFDAEYITESEMNAGETTPPGYNPTEGEKSIIEQSQMSVDDFLRNADEDKAKAYQEGTSNTPVQNRKNLLDKTKDCQ